MVRGARWMFLAQALGHPAASLNVRRLHTWGHSELATRHLSTQLPGLPAMKSFFASQCEQPKGLVDNSLPYRLFLGNEAADADSIISSICYAYMSWIHDGKPSAGAARYLPVMTVPRDELPLRRDVEILLERVGLSWDNFLTLQDLRLPPGAAVHVTLLDHNAAHAPFLQTIHTHHPPVVVQEILDHHLDSHQFPHVTESLRHIAFDSLSQRALVASTCTLVWERMTTWQLTDLLPDVTELLAGVILLDTVNFNPALKKATERDRQAFAAIVAQLPALEPAALFETLHAAKTDVCYWRSLSLSNALKFDYKLFVATPWRVGMSSVLLPLRNLLADRVAPVDDGREKKEVLHAGERLRAFLAQQEVDVLVIMSIFSDEAAGGELVRELAVVGYDRPAATSAVAQELVTALEGLDHADDPSALQLKGGRVDAFSKDGLAAWVYQQGQVASSRKQVAPLVVKALEGCALNSS